MLALLFNWREEEKREHEPRYHDETSLSAADRIKTGLFVGVVSLRRWLLFVYARDLLGCLRMRQAIVCALVWLFECVWMGFRDKCGSGVRVRAWMCAYKMRARMVYGCVLVFGNMARGCLVETIFVRRSASSTFSHSFSPCCGCILVLLFVELCCFCFFARTSLSVFGTRCEQKQSEWSGWKPVCCQM